MLKKLKKILIQSPFYKASLQIQSIFISSSWMLNSKNRVQDNSTIYVISSYKTGTSYITSRFRNEISKHEPYQYVSYRKLSTDFDKHFVRRLNYLNVKIEASGFLFYHVEQLAKNPIAKNLNYICILRKPSAWVTSFINYMLHEIKAEINPTYNWTDELILKKLLGVDLSNFYDLGEEEQSKIAEKLIDSYLENTKKTKLLKNVTYVWINELEEFTNKLGPMIGEEVKPQEKSYQNKGNSKKYIYKNDTLDDEYSKIVDSLIKEI